MEPLVASLRPLAEILGFMKDALVTAAVLFGARQVLLAQRQLREDHQRSLDEHERASKTVSLEYASDFASRFGPTYVAFIETVVRAGLRPYAGPVTDFSFNSIPQELRTAAVERSRLPYSSELLHQLEVFAAAHTTGVADDETGFRMNGRMFCLIVSQDLYDVLAIEHEQGYYHTVVELYETWAPRVARERLVRSKELLDLQKAAMDKVAESRLAELEAEKAAIEEQLKELPESETKRPIGVR